MEFSVVTCEDDGDYDPVAQYKWNLDHDFVNTSFSILLSNTSVDENLRQNEDLQRKLEKLAATILEMIDEQDNWDQFVSECEQTGKAISSTPVFSEGTCKATISVLNALIKMELIGEVEDYQEYIWDCLDKMITSPACPRPVIWKIVKH